MPKKEIHLNDKYWQHKRLFQTKRNRPLKRISFIFSILIAFSITGWLLQ